MYASCDAPSMMLVGGLDVEGTIPTDMPTDSSTASRTAHPYRPLRDLPPSMASSSSGDTLKQRRSVIPSPSSPLPVEPLLPLSGGPVGDVLHWGARPWVDPATYQLPDGPAGAERAEAS